MTPVTNFSTSSASVIDTGGKFAPLISLPSLKRSSAVSKFETQRSLYSNFVINFWIRIKKNLFLCWAEFLKIQRNCLMIPGKHNSRYLVWDLNLSFYFFTDPVLGKLFCDINIFEWKRSWTWMHLGGKRVASSVPGAQAVTGCGSRYRRSANGGRANGIPVAYGGLF